MSRIEQQRAIRRTAPLPWYVLTVFFVFWAVLIHLHFVEWRGDHWSRGVLPTEGLYVPYSQIGEPAIAGIWVEEFCKVHQCPSDGRAALPIEHTRLGLFQRADTVFPWTQDGDELKRRTMIYGIAVPILLIFCAAFALSFALRRSGSSHRLPD